ncbi:MAG TPA: hypothetical protein VGI70_12905 [Polyangiales bacterium]|jgi:hypothetical protein
MSPSEEQLAIEAAKRHPIAQPRERPLYPESSPPPLPERGMPTEAPPPLNPNEAGPYAQNEPPSAPPPDSPNADQNAGPTSAEAIAPSPPPPDNQDAPDSPAPGADYVWAPGYWSWAGAQYVWAPGEWIERRPGYVYVRPRWVQTGYGWQFAVGGWGPAGGTTVVYPVYGRSYYGPRYDDRRGPEREYRYRGEVREAPRARDRVYVAPRAEEAPRRESSTAPRSAPTPREAPQRVERQPSRAAMPAGMQAGGDRTRHESSQPNPTAAPNHAPAATRAVRVREPPHPTQHRETVRP